MTRQSPQILAAKIQRMAGRYSAEGMAKLTGKSKSYIQIVACYNGISLAKQYFKWDADKDRRLIELRKSGKTSAQIGEAVGCDKRSVDHRVTILKRRKML